MTAEDDKLKKRLKGMSAIDEVERIAKQYEATRLTILDSPAMREIEEQSKRWNELMTPTISQFTASSAALNYNTEMFRVSRVAEETIAQFSSTARSLALDFPAMDTMARQYAELYRDPFQGEVDKIIGNISSQSLSASNAATLLIQTHAEEIRKITESIHTPWVNSQNVLASIRGLEGLSTIGKTLRESIHPFESSITHHLRDQLGDWRHASFSETLGLEPLQRSELYTKQGLNPLLTDYPSDAFDDALSASDIRSKQVKPVIPSYQLPSEIEPDVDEPPTHMIEAYRIIYSFESRIRRFIDEVMTEKYGPKWTKQRVPGDMRKGWVEKKTKALDSGEAERPLICYADFTHYEPVIVRSDNWDEVFKPIFRNKESVIESLRRLYPMRNPTMHSRIIISEDMLYLYAETRRLISAIEGYPSKRRSN